MPLVPDQPQPQPPPRTPRAEPREVVELKQLKTAQPDLAGAVDMQLALVDMQRRVQSRVPLPWIQVDTEWLRAQRAAGRPIVRFADIPLEWTDFRLTLRQTADILRRHFGQGGGVTQRKGFVVFRHSNVLWDCVFAHSVTPHD